MYKSFDVGSLLGNVNSENKELNLEQGAVFKRNKQTQKISKIDSKFFLSNLCKLSSIFTIKKL